MKRRLQAYLSQQLKHPSGWVGRLILQQLNRENSIMNQLLLQQLDLQPGQQVLEIGFGGGDFIDRLLKKDLSLRIYGIDPSAAAIAMVQRRFKDAIKAQTLALHQTTVDNLPWPDQTFDAIATINTLYFWPDVQSVLQECYLVLKPGGSLAIAYTAKAFLEEQQATQFGFNAYEVSELEQYLHVAGYSEIKTLSGECRNNGQFFCTSGMIIRSP